MKYARLIHELAELLAKRTSYACRPHSSIEEDEVRQLAEFIMQLSNENVDEQAAPKRRRAAGSQLIPLRPDT
jgi:hypothetical protein